MTTERIVLGAATASVIAIAAYAHSGASGVVKERMDAMGAMQDAMKRLLPVMQGQADYDAEAVRTEAAIIAGLAGEALTRMFPEDSIAPPSEAKEAIWQDWDSFAAMSEQLEVAANGLAAAADNGLMMSGSGNGGMMTGGGMMGGAGMKGQTPMMGADLDAMDFAQMPADGVFAMMGQVCSACHGRFRAEKQ